MFDECFRRRFPAQQSGGGHPWLLGDEDSRHHPRRDRGRPAVDDAQPGLRGQLGHPAHHLRRPAGCAAVGAALPPGTVLVGGVGHQHRRYHHVRPARPHAWPGLRHRRQPAGRLPGTGAAGVAAVGEVDLGQQHRIASRRRLLLDRRAVLQHARHRIGGFPRRRFRAGLHRRRAADRQPHRAHRAEIGRASGWERV
ncbi:hypothetical protein G6F35_011285 [Rhizopus arrhizus]|nr:hypothetical protein G6F35_011285 [Rhizopus arrhizus]